MSPVILFEFLIVYFDMCTHCKTIINKYTHESIYVSCGRCPDCQIKKSNIRYSRIMNHLRDKDYFTLFVTLTYSPEFVPFVCLDESSDNGVFNVYRLKDVRYSTRKGIRHRNVKEGSLISTVDLGSSKHFDETFSGVKQLQDHPISNCFGVCLSSEFSNFIKRFCVNSRRYYGIKINNSNFSYFRISEYGPTTGRPHFHALLFFPPSFRLLYSQLKRALLSSWSFGDYGRLKKSIQVANHPEKYLSLYTVRPTDYPEVLSCNQIRAKHSFSRGFGLNQPDFLSDSILEKVRRRDFEYSFRTVRQGLPSTVACRIPRYVFDRFFPSFKGLYLLDNDSLIQYLAYGLIGRFKQYLSYTDDEVMVYSRRLQRAKARLGCDGLEYFFLYQSYKTGIASYSYIHSRINCPIDEYYDNVQEVFNSYGLISSPILNDMVAPYVLNIDGVNYLKDPNTFQHRINSDVSSSEKYDDFLKKAKFGDYSPRIEYVRPNINHKSYNYA